MLFGGKNSGLSRCVSILLGLSGVPVVSSRVSLRVPRVSWGALPDFLGMHPAWRCNVLATVWVRDTLKQPETRSRP